MEACLFSFSYAGFWDFITHASKLGYSSVMIAGKRPHLSPLAATPEFVKPIQDTLGATPSLPR
jgi:hypothetical protein